MMQSSTQYTLTMNNKQYYDIQSELYYIAIEKLVALATKKGDKLWFDYARSEWQSWLAQSGLDFAFEQFKVYDFLASRAIALSI